MKPTHRDTGEVEVERRCCLVVGGVTVLQLVRHTVQLAVGHAALEVEVHHNLLPRLQRLPGAQAPRVRGQAWTIRMLGRDVSRHSCPTDISQHRDYTLAAFQYLWPMSGGPSC